MTDLPPHDPTRRCVKCQTLAVATVEYRARQPQLVWSGDTLEEIVTHGPTGGECLLRTCTDCGWAWLEACADTPAEMVTEIPTGTGGSIEFHEPVTRSWAEDFRDQFIQGMPTDLTVMRGPDAVGP